METTAAAVPSVFTVVDGGVPDSALSTEQLGSRIVALSGRLASAMCRWLLLVAEFDAREGQSKLGMASTAQWLQYSCGIAHRTAVEHVRVARSLRAWPRIAEQMAAGRLSYSQVRAISRVASGPVEGSMATGELVETLLNTARYGTVVQLEVMVRGLRSIYDVEHPVTERAERERVSQSWTEQSQWQLSARLDPERGAQVDSALAAVAKAEGLSQPDALVRLAEIGLAALADGGSPRGLRGAEQAAIIVHVTAADVPTDDADDATDRGDRAGARSRERDSQPGLPFGRVEHGPGLPASVVERLACIGRVRLAVRDRDNQHSDVLDLGRARRLVTKRQCQALTLRDGDGCAYPGCGNHDGLEAHHVRHWLYGGKTDMDNLLMLCKAHHLAHHEGEFTIQPLGRGGFRFLRNHRELPRWVDASTLIDDPTPIENEHAHVAPDAATPKWDGSKMDRTWAVNVACADLNLPASA